MKGHVLRFKRHHVGSPASAPKTLFETNFRAKFRKTLGSCNLSEDKPGAE